MSDPQPPSSAPAADKQQQPINPSPSSPPSAPNIESLMILQQPPLPTDPFVTPNPNKRPRYATSSSGSQWKQLLPVKLPVQQVTSSPSSSTNPPLQLLLTQHQSSSDTAASSPPRPDQKQQQQEQHCHGHVVGQLIRKGKHVSPVWKPYEMLILAKAWHVQYKSSSSSSAESGRGTKSRAEKDREVAEFLNRHGVDRDAKAAGTKWDNMLGDFRKVYQWERGGGRIEAGVGKSYFRLSPYERKNQHGLPTSFDEEVFEEMAQFMGPRMRTSCSSSFLQQQHFKAGGGDDDGGKDKAHQLPLIISGNLEQANNAPLRRIGKMRMVWEESVSLWGEEGKSGRGRVRIGLPTTTASPSSCGSFLYADELIFFDDSMVASSLEVFETGPLRGFSIDMFSPGQQLKVFGRRKAAAASAYYCHACRVQLPGTEPSIRSSAAAASELLEYHDPSEYYLDRLKMSPATLPSLSELSLYLQKPPSEELKFPLRRDVYRDLPQGKELFFTTSNELLDCRMVTLDILGPVLASNLSAFSTPSSRDSYVALWDDCINRVVRQFCSLEIACVRKPSATEILWPNVTGFVSGLCLWRGEETGQVREGETEPSASESLERKTLWSYADLPYIFGYYAVGCTVTFCALSHRSKDNKVSCTDLISIDLSSAANRLKAMIPCWRIATLLPLLADKCSLNQGNGPFSDFERIALGNGDVIERTPSSQIRFFSSKRRWASVKEIYDFLDRRIPHSEYMAESSEQQLSITFEPRGCKVKPRSVEQLIEALKSVTKSLVALHDLSFMHRDISWETVLRRVDSENERQPEWFLGGFEVAAGAPQMSAVGGGSGGGAHAPEMRRGLHSVKVDVWGIGWLIKTCGLGAAMLPMQLMELQSRCLEHNQEMRPTAADCYHHLLQLSAAAAGGY